MTAQAASSWASAKDMLHGLGMWYQNKTYTMNQWNDECKLAAKWKMTWVHPKVADGGQWWYSDNNLREMAHIAHLHGLKIAPYHYCWGGRLLTLEANVCAKAGTIFDAVCPDIEGEWNNHPDWARQFGKIVREQHKSSALIFPTLFPNPNSHPTPYVELNAWITGWIPMAYFCVWSTSHGMMTAKEAVAYLYPQWLALDAKLLAKTKQHAKPIFPLIGTYPTQEGVRLHPAEVESWLKLMYRYGYCGFWYKGEYGPYAETVEKTCFGNSNVSAYLVNPEYMPAKPAATLAAPLPLTNPMTPLPDVLKVPTMPLSPMPLSLPQVPPSPPTQPIPPPLPPMVAPKALTPVPGPVSLIPISLIPISPEPEPAPEPAPEPVTTPTPEPVQEPSIVLPSLTSEQVAALSVLDKLLHQLMSPPAPAPVPNGEESQV